ADLRITRIRYIKMCGDIAKHNLPRLVSNVGHLKRLLQNSGHAIDDDMAYVAINNFFEWFHDNIFLYHSNGIAEFLNNIRWSIYDYMKAEFERSWHVKSETESGLVPYEFIGPPKIKEPLAHAMYWSLMNRYRSKPMMCRFVISRNLKLRY
ncbi:MAG: hypothetical protein AAFY02_22250, partial [Pseudomonadota bacterium]